MTNKFNLKLPIKIRETLTAISDANGSTVTATMLRLITMALYINSIYELGGKVFVQKPGEDKQTEIIFQ